LPTKHKHYELYLCEKPSQGRDIAKALGIRQFKSGYFQDNKHIVTWCIGHLLEMIPPDGYDSRYKRWDLTDLPIIPAKWQLKAKKSTQKQLSVIKKLLAQSKRVVIATDADREGETIAREVLEHFNYQGSIARLWLSALDNISIQRALKNIRKSEETIALYYSGLARGRADWLIGMNLSRAFTLLANDRQVRSVGRVQTPTLALIVKRDQQIQSFKAESYYEVMAYFQYYTEQNEQHKAQLLNTQWQFPGNNSTDKQHKHCFDKHVAQQLINRCLQQQGSVRQASTQRKKQAAPLLYNLSALQQEASHRWGYGAQEVLNIAQALYETHKLTTYPRTDSEYLPLSQFNDVSRIFQALCQTDPGICQLLTQARQQQRSRVWNDKKISAHHAIIPTQTSSASVFKQLKPKELNIYDLIRRRYIAQFFADYEYDQSIIIIAIKQDQFKASGRIPRVQGWKQVIYTPSAANSKNKTRTTGKAKEQELPALTEAEQLLCTQLEMQHKHTKPPSYFTEGTLIKAMETIGSQVTDKVMKKILRATAGLGTQATRANIIETLLQRHFIKKDNKHIKATPLGFELCKMLPETIKDPLLTAQWEQQLDDIAQHRGQDIDGFLQQQISLLKVIIRQLKETDYQPQKTRQKSTFKVGDTCPECGHALEFRQAVRGSKIGQRYIGCSAFPQCRFYSW